MVLRAYETASIGVGKVQVSAAVTTPMLDPMSIEERRAVFAQLGEFREERYLHQTVISDDLADEPEFYEDLPEALRSRNYPDEETGEWRVHFHVPIYLERFGKLLATQSDIRECLAAAERHSDVAHFEVETYAWAVLPPELSQSDLASGIAREMKWYIDLLNSRNGE
jgi:hypothetical protein